MIPHYIGEYKPELNFIVFESARDSLMEGDDKLIVKRGFERINNMIERKSYMKNEDPENKEFFSYRFKHKKTDKVYNYILIGCELDELYENDKSFNFSSNSLLNKEVVMINF